MIYGQRKILFFKLYVSLFLAGSIEKPFVSTALMILSERGRIDLHKPVNDYIGESAMIAYQGDASHATISRLLLHTTGMPYGYYTAGNGVSQEQKRSNKDLIDLSGVIITPPGTRYMYTNIGYGLLGEIVHDVGGENIKEFIKREIIDSLRLPNTRFFKETPSIDLIATQNAKDGVLPITFDNKGYTALYSTATDLVRFGMFHMKSHLLDQKPILTDESIDILWKFNESKVKFSTRRMCWDVQQDFGFETVQHGGAGPGIHNWLYMIPSENIIIAILSNSRYNSPESDPVLKALINASLTESGKKKHRPNEGRGWFIRPKTSSIDFHGEWIGIIKGPKGECRVDIKFDHEGFPSMKTEGNSFFFRIFSSSIFNSASSNKVAVSGISTKISMSLSSVLSPFTIDPNREALFTPYSLRTGMILFFISGIVIVLLPFLIKS